MRETTRRGFVLLAVLVIVGSALLIVTALVYFAQSEAAGYAVSRDRAQQSAMVASAIDVIMPRLNAQRERILAGQLPELDEQYELYDRNGRAGVARLLPIGPGRRLLQPEAAKIDLNAVDAKMLAAMEMIDEALAERITAFRDELPGAMFRSVAELLHVDGVTVEMLYGPFEDWQQTLATSAQATEEFSAAWHQPTDRVALADVLTVFAFEPMLQRDGRKRINLNVPWSDELAGRLNERFGEGTAQIVKSIIDEGTSFDDESAIYRVLNFFNVELDDWPDIADALTTEQGEYHFGRLDINTASHEALISLPTIGPEQAAQIVQQRAGLSDDERATIAWPVFRGVLDRQQYESLGGLITTRSWTYRVHFAVGEVDEQQPDGPLDGAMVCEAVFDLAAPTPRVAYLRDITMLNVAATLAATKGMIESDEPRTAHRSLPDAEVNWRHQPMPVSATGLGDSDLEMDDVTVDNSPDHAAEQSDELPNAAPTRQRIGRWRGG